MSEEPVVRADAVRAVLREVFLEIAAARSMTPPADVLADVLRVDRDVPAPVLAEVRASVRPADLTEIEALGHAYESLMAPAARKHAGAHYTPRALADEVVEHALAPLAGHDPLDLRVADIAAGSGVFLLAAARRLAADGAGVREVVTTCLFGADVDPTAVEICRLSLWLLAGDPDLPLTFLDDRILCGDSLLGAEPVGERRGIDWPTVLPGIAARGGFDAVVGNPPFLGVKNIRAALGAQVRDRYARDLLGGISGRSDLVVFFLAQAARLSRDVVALVLPDAVSEGDSARFGLAARIADGFRIYRADTSRPWPSEAGVRIALVWLRRGSEPPAVLDGRPAEVIGPHLGRTAASAVARSAVVPDWVPHGYQATIVLGKSLVLGRDLAAAMVAEDPRADAWIRDYLTGDDLVSAAGSPSSRRVLDLGSVSLEDALRVPVVARHLDLVRAEREAQLAKYPQLADRWWRFLSPVERLYADLDGLAETIAFSKHAKYIWPVLVPTGPVFSNGLIVYPSQDRAVYAFLASTPHRLWAVDEGGSRLNQSHRYNPSRFRRTYPFPDSCEAARPAGEQLADAVGAAQAVTGLGTTDLLNRVHGDAPVGPEVAAVRAAIAEVDRAVLALHGIDERFEHALVTEHDRTRFGMAPADEARLKALLLG